MSRGALSFVVLTSSRAVLEPLFVRPAGDQVVQFGAGGALQEGGQDSFEAGVPYRAGMTELVVESASLQLRGDSVDQPLASVAKSDPDAPPTITGPADAPGSELRQLRLEGFSLTPPAARAMALTADGGSTSGWQWQLEDAKTVFRRRSDGRQVHVLVRVGVAGAVLGPPVVAAPGYAMPGSGGRMYGPVLAGATLRLDDPAPGAARIDLDPPVPAATAQIVVGHNDKTARTEGLPHELDALPWTASAVHGVWTSRPSDVELQASSSSSSERVPVASFPGPVRQPGTVDLAAAARALLPRAYLASSGEAVRLLVAATSSSPGDLVASGFQIRARYRYDAVKSAPVSLTLTGGTEHAILSLPGGAAPDDALFTLDGRFSPATLLASSDRERLDVHSGLRLAPGIRVRRRVVIGEPERGRPLIRVGAFGRCATGAEVLAVLLGDLGGRPGAALSPPVALRIPAASDPQWHRGSFDVALDVGRVGAVWVQLWAASGSFSWFAPPQVPDEPANGPLDVALSLDDGATWAAGAGLPRPLVQVHYEAERAEPMPLRLTAAGQPLIPDVLALAAGASRIETTLASAVSGAAALAMAGPATSPPGAVARARATKSAAYRLHDVRLLAANALAALDGAGACSLSFSCERDVTVRVEAAAFTYDPWGGGG